MKLLTLITGRQVIHPNPQLFAAKGKLKLIDGYLLLIKSGILDPVLDPVDASELYNTSLQFDC